MSEFKLTTVEEFEAATNRLLETGAKVGADSWQMRVKNQTPHCKFGEHWPIRSSARRISGWNSTTSVSRPTCSSELSSQVTVRIFRMFATR